MDEGGRGKLVGLIRQYLTRSAEELSEAAWRRIERAGLDTVTFAWAGPADRGQGHYYAVSGPTFMIEYDNVQNDTNHVHSVWRDPQGDFGRDVLAAHYRRDH